MTKTSTSVARKQQDSTHQALEELFVLHISHLGSTWHMQFLILNVNTVTRVRKDINFPLRGLPQIPPHQAFIW